VPYCDHPICGDEEAADELMAEAFASLPEEVRNAPPSRVRDQAAMTHLFVFFLNRLTQDARRREQQP